MVGGAGLGVLGGMVGRGNLVVANGLLDHEFLKVLDAVIGEAVILLNLGAGPLVFLVIGGSLLSLVCVIPLLLFIVEALVDALLNVVVGDLKLWVFALNKSLGFLCELRIIVNRLDKVGHLGTALKVLVFL